MGHLSTYFIEDKKSRAVKIGKSFNVFARLRQLQTGCANPLSIAMILPIGIEFMGDCKSGEWDEAAMHRRFRKARLAGEWFRMTPEIKTFLEEMRRLGA